MALPSSPNSISLKQIQTEFGGVDPISISEYYRNGSYTTSNNTNVPVDSTIHPPIKFSNFYGTVKEILVVVSATTTNLNVSSLFGSYWTQTIPKRVVINSGVIIGATNTSNYALNIPSGFGGTVKIDNNGSIRGAGGASNGGDGGPAILAGASGVSIDNQGTIYGGGGGGGKGGTGGAGTYTSLGAFQALGASGWNTFPGYGYGQYGYRCQQTCIVAFPSYSNVYASFAGVSNPYRDKYCCVACCYGRCCDCCTNDAEQNANASCCYGQPTVTNSSAGGIGGSGGVGQGYNQSATTAPIFGATNGPLDGGTNAGRGGVGGNGSTWGTSGGNGSAGANGNPGLAVQTVGVAGGPAYGGLGGYYIVNNGNVTWITTGTRLGRVG